MTVLHLRGQNLVALEVEDRVTRAVLIGFGKMSSEI